MKKQIITAVLSISLGIFAMGQETQPESQALTYSQIKEVYPSAQEKGVGKLGTQATIELKNGLIFLNGHDGDKLLQGWGIYLRLSMD